MKTFSKKPGDERSRPVDCPVCGASDKRPFALSDDFTFVRCSSCGLIYQDPQPVSEDLSLRYDEEYFEYERRNEDNFYNLMRLGLKDVRFEELAAALPKQKRFLDIGCATGRLIHALSEEGWSAEGVELCRPSAEFGRKERNLRIYAGTLEEAGFPNESFHVVHASHLIEHLTDPVAFIREVRRILLPGGYAVLVTPNAAGLQARLYRERWRSAIPDHICLFSMKTLKDLISREGFRVIRTKTWGGIATGKAPRAVKKVADRAAKSFGFGDVMIILARSTARSTGIDRKI